MTKLLLTPQGSPQVVDDEVESLAASTPGPAVVFSTTSATGESRRGADAEEPRPHDSASALTNRPIAYRESGRDWHELGYEAADHWEGLSPELRDRLIADRTAQLSRAEFSVTTSGASASMITSNWTYSGSPRVYRIAGELRELAEVLAEISD